MRSSSWRPAAAVAAGAAGLAGATATAVAGYFARQVITPGRVKPDDVQVLAVDTDSQPPTVTLGRTPDTQVPGRYGLWLDRGFGHARVGEIQRCDPTVVVRELLGVDFGQLTTGPARWNQYYFAGPPARSLGLPHTDVLIKAEVGRLPAWLIADPDPASTCAVLVHGLSATREECLRAVPPLRALGLDVVIPLYRNDIGAPLGPSGRYHLGDSEWRDVEAAMTWALQRGAQRILLCGWSMGGAIVLAAARRSALAGQIMGIIANAPVVQWQHVMDHHAALHRLPRPVNRLGQWMLGQPATRRPVGLAEPLRLSELDSLAKADELQHPVLLIHSDADEYVPNGPSLAFAKARPDLITAVPWAQGRHTKEWNTDPQRWERVVTDFVSAQLAKAH